jgi:adenosylmethionine-8-amino-7-oxononanoate aminotransferase
MNRFAQLDRRYVWHPFTQMKDWLALDPIVISSGRGAVLRDVHGNEYLDANSSIWTNLHGHAHPVQPLLLPGLANEPASVLAAKPCWRQPTSGGLGLRTRSRNGRDAASAHSKSHTALNKVFFSDDGSTAMASRLSRMNSRDAPVAVAGPSSSR